MLLRSIVLRIAAIRGVDTRSIHRHGCSVLLHRCGCIVLLCRGVLVSRHDLRTTVKCPSHASGESRGGVGHDPLHWIGRSALRSNVHLWRSAPRTPWSSVLQGLGHLEGLVLRLWAGCHCRCLKQFVKQTSRSWAGCHSWTLECSTTHSHAWSMTARSTCSIKL